jgi:integrase
MASISTDENGNVRILFIGADKKRRAVHLGRVNKKLAGSIKLRVEALVASIVTRTPIDSETAQWVSVIGDDLAAKLSGVGLMPPRESRKLRTFLDTYIAGRENDGHTKPATLITIRRVADDLVTAMKAEVDLRSVSAEHAEQFKQFYQDKGLAPATTYRRLKMAKMLFAHALKLKHVAENPFADVKAKNSNAVDRRHYITAEDTLRLIDAANPTWRTVIALARFAGLRCPSEVLSLKWENIDFASGRMTVSSPKTAHLEGRSYRVVPIFARLRPYLEEAFELAEPGEVYVVGGSMGQGYRATSQKPGGWVNTNMRTTFEKLIRRAGLKPWPRLFHNLRASCETDLMQDHPIHVVTAWIGNTPKIALGHYLQTLDGDFEKAVRGDAETGARRTQKAAQTGADVKGRERTESSEEPAFSGVPSDSVRSGLILSDCSGGQGGTRTHTVLPARF